MNKPFEDTSCFQCWAQYVDEFGNKWRREEKFSGYYYFYELIDDAYIKCGQLLTDRKSIYEIHKEFLEQLHMEI